MVDQGEDLRARGARPSIPVSGNHSARAGVHHFLGVAQLVAIGSRAERMNMAARPAAAISADGDRASSADDHIGPAKRSAMFVRNGRLPRWRIAPRVCGAYGVVIAFAGLMHDGESFLRAASGPSRPLVRLIASAP